MIPQPSWLTGPDWETTSKAFGTTTDEGLGGIGVGVCLGLGGGAGIADAGAGARAERAAPATLERPSCPHGMTASACLPH